VIGTHTTRLRDPPTYRPLNAENVLYHLRSLGILDRNLGGTSSQWRAHECGDGNLNLVFVVQGPSGAVVVKQALPYVRMVGESWPLSVRRNFFEHAALLEQARWAADFVPAVYHGDEDMALIAMEFLAPHSVLRTEFIGARIYPRVGEHLGRFLARTLFNTSELRLSGQAKKERMAIFLANTAMCRISEDLIFDEPYFAAPMNRHTSPQLDSVATALTRDVDLKLAVQAMKWRFTNQPESLIHGDLHTGSVMVTEHDTRVIDPEFAFYGPMGFDIGVLFANFLMAYLSQAGHAARAGDREEFGSYLLHQLTAIWTTFVSEFTALWRERGSLAEANLYNPRLDLASPAFSDRALTWRVQQIWHDALGFAGCEVIRRILGLAHVADFETIADPDRRADCEQRAILLARELLIERSRYSCISELTALARACQ
jgi:5-methylthioribose kinase